MIYIVRVVAVKPISAITCFVFLFCLVLYIFAIRVFISLLVLDFYFDMMAKDKDLLEETY